MASSRKKKKDEFQPLPTGLLMIGLGIYGSTIHLDTNLLLVLFISGMVCLGIWQDQEGKKKKLALLTRDVAELSPRDFELFVAQVFGGLHGWKAEATRASGDQGADVIAVSPKGKRIAVQVKHYKSTVGNSAVQEIVAAKALYRAEEAMVVTSGKGFTAAARELARANNVTLWTLTELGQVQQFALERKAPPANLLSPY